MEAKIISFQDAKKRQYCEAFEWAVNEQKDLGLVASPINIHFDGDWLEHDKDKCTISVFVNEEGDKAILRRDWDQDMLVQYNLITNLREIKETAPKALQELMDNGVHLRKRYKKAFL